MIMTRETVYVNNSSTAFNNINAINFLVITGTVYTTTIASLDLSLTITYLDETTEEVAIPVTEKIEINTDNHRGMFNFETTKNVKGFVIQNPTNEGEFVDYNVLDVIAVYQQNPPVSRTTTKV